MTSFKPNYQNAPSHWEQGFNIGILREGTQFRSQQWRLFSLLFITVQYSIFIEAIFNQSLLIDIFIVYRQCCNKLHVCMSFHSFTCDSPGGTSGKEPSCRRHKRHRFDPSIRKIPWRRAQQLIPVFLPENPTDREACLAIVHRIAKSQIQLKQLSKHAHKT